MRAVFGTASGDFFFPASPPNPFGAPVLDDYLHCSMMYLCLGCLILLALQPHWPAFHGSSEVPCLFSPQSLGPAIFTAFSSSCPCLSISCDFLTTFFLLWGCLQVVRCSTPGSDILTIASSDYSPNSSDSITVCFNIGLLHPNRAGTLAVTSHA